MQQMLDKGVFIPVDTKEMKHEEVKKVIRSSMFLKEKHLADGSFDKLKARLVAGGNMQDKSLYDDISSPTVSTTAVFITAAIAAAEQRHVITIDIGGAYLNAHITTHRVYMSLDPYLANVLSILDRSYEAYKRHNGCIIVELKRALYGCIESARLWYLHISSTLTSELSYIPNGADKCVFNKVMNGAQCTICIHVDDCMITSTNNIMIEELIDGLRRKYQDIKINEGKVHSYLGLSFD
jgi:hypothetical protein